MKIYTCTITHMWNNEMKPMTASFSTRKKSGDVRPKNS